MKSWLQRWWLHLVAGLVVLAVSAPAAVASYKHHWTVVNRHNQEMADWLPLTTDGMLLAGLLVLVAVRWGRPFRRWVWWSVGVAFGLGLPVTLAGNLVAMLPTTQGSLLVETIVVAVWPPITVAITLELAALLVMPTRLPNGRRPVGPLAAPAAPEAAGTRRRSALDVTHGEVRVNAVPIEVDQLSAGPTPDLQEPVLGQDTAAEPAETGPTGDQQHVSDRPDETSPVGPDAAVYARVAELVRAGRGRPYILKELAPLGVRDGKPLRDMMDRARTNGDGHG